MTIMNKNRTGKRVGIITGKLTSKSQITIPKAIIEEIGLKSGDHVQFEIVDGGVFLKPMALVDKSQAWFWSKEWQEGEKEIDEHIRAGRVKTANSLDELLEDLDSDAN